MASPTLITPSTSTPKPLTPIRSKLSSTTTAANAATVSASVPSTRRREFLSLAAGILAPALLLPSTSAFAASDEEYVREASEVIKKVRSTLSMEKGDPNIADSVTELREASNYWVAKYRREKALLGRASFRDIYSALNAVSGHYVSFGPTTPIPAKRKQRILEEMDTAEKALQRGR
ncbi:photosystem II repair protein PSB27-H1, chloroplastic-like [Nicotiana tabacum]|uniref:Photosystem II repair protein PSB27-H1, chloroplastic-like n=1 Tax=Nicotiana tabacum TaxID=4097 RepID=A0A1S4DRV5_TOBAC|nr:photosystem II repair protein PSB27-H1, chloroplastic [Nicotiana tomentosiformis]XP_016516160.1 PREDICTED: photosystem II repair protein PSB27-H1, chloroplastic-like [Nicotiana tabacum]